MSDGSPISTTAALAGRVRVMRSAEVMGIVGAEGDGSTSGCCWTGSAATLSGRVRVMRFGDVMPIPESVEGWLILNCEFGPLMA